MSQQQHTVRVRRGTQVKNCCREEVAVPEVVLLLAEDSVELRDVGHPDAPVRLSLAEFRHVAQLVDEFEWGIG